MQFHQITSNTSDKNKKRVGRGGKRGTYSGRGNKGQKARAGRKLRPEWRDVLKRIPKRRGYTFKGNQAHPVVLNLDKLSEIFKSGELIDANILVKKGLVAKAGGRLPEIKILGQGELKKKLSFKGLNLSESAREKVLQAGGEIK